MDTVASEESAVGAGLFECTHRQKQNRVEYEMCSIGTMNEERKAIPDVCIVNDEDSQ